MDWSSLSPEDRERIILSSVDLIRTLTETLGNDDTALRVWDSIAASMGDEARSEIFFSLFSDQIRGKIKIRQVPPNQHIPLARILIKYTGMTVSEAKDVIQVVAGRWDPHTGKRDAPQIGACAQITVPAQKRQQCCEELQKIGITIS